MIEVKGMDIPGDMDLENVDDVNSGIHKEYNLLVFKYANLLKNYLQLLKDHQELLEKDNKVIQELMELRARDKKNTIRFGSRVEDDLK